MSQISTKLPLNIALGIAANLSRVLVQLILLPVMARLLGPDQIGLFALAMPLITFTLMLADAGIGESLAREKDLNSAVWPSAFWSILGLSVLLAALVNGTTIVLASIVDNPSLPMIVFPLSVSIILYSFSVVPGALMLRSGRMAVASSVEIVNQLLSGLIAILLGWYGYGIWALVVQMLFAVTFRTISLNYLFPFRPRFLFDISTLASHKGVTGAILGTRLIDLASRFGENNLVSVMLGPTAVGTYSYSNQIGRFFSDALVNPIWSNIYYLSITHDRDEAFGYYLRFQRLGVLVLLPLANIAAFSAQTVLPEILGKAWAGSTLPIILFLLSSPFAALGNLHGSICLAFRRGKIILTFLSIYSLARLLTIALCAELGITTIVILISFLSLLYYVIVNTFVPHVLGFSRSIIFLAVWKLILINFLSASALWLWLPNDNVVSLLLSSFIFAVLYFMLCLYWEGDKFKEDISQLYQLVSRVWRRSATPNGDTDQRDV